MQVPKSYREAKGVFAVWKTGHTPQDIAREYNVLIQKCKPRERMCLPCFCKGRIDTVGQRRWTLFCSVALGVIGVALLWKARYLEERCLGGVAIVASAMFLTMQTDPMASLNLAVHNDKRRDSLRAQCQSDSPISDLLETIDGWQGPLRYNNSMNRDRLGAFRVGGAFAKWNVLDLEDDKKKEFYVGMDYLIMAYALAKQENGLNDTELNHLNTEFKALWEQASA